MHVAVETANRTSSDDSLLPPEQPSEAEDAVFNHRGCRKSEESTGLLSACRNSLSSFSARGLCFLGAASAILCDQLVRAQTEGLPESANNDGELHIYHHDPYLEQAWDPSTTLGKVYIGVAAVAGTAFLGGVGYICYKGCQLSNEVDRGFANARHRFGSSWV